MVKIGEFIILLIKRYTKWAILSSTCGILSGVAATIFLFLLKWATEARDLYPALIWLLPLAGFFIGWVYYRYGKDVVRGSDLVLAEIHSPQKILPLKMAPFILFSTVLTHLFGGSAGREGSAVQMGASLSDQLAKYMPAIVAERKILLAAGAGAGFGAAIGAPWAGMIFGMEFMNTGRLRLFAVFECFVASFVGYYTTILLHAPHTHYPRFTISTYTFKIFLWVAVAAIFFGLAARIFCFGLHFVEQKSVRLISYPPLRPLCGGLILSLLYWFEGSYNYAGLGLPIIQQALTSPGHFTEPLLKAIATAITVGTGFKGGEFIPLVFIGSTLGSALALILPISFQLLSGLGFAAVFGAAANTPIACTIMAIEIFGVQIAPYALLACILSYFVSGPHSIYKAQANW